MLLKIPGAILLLTSSLTATAASKGTPVAVDSSTGEPLPAASVFDRRGNLAGICSDNGVFPYIPASAYPLTVRYIGYAPATVDDPSALTVRLDEITYDLPEVTVAPGKRVVLYLTAHVREYSTLTTYTDTIFLFREKTVDFMIPTKKAGKYRGWTQPRLLDSRSYYRFAAADGTDSVSNSFGQHFSWSDWIGIPRLVELPLKLQTAGAATDTVYGRYSPACIWRRDDDNVVIDINVMADTANRRWVPGLFARNHRDVEFTDLRLKYTFADAGKYSVAADNITAMTFNIETNGRGASIYNIFRRNEPYFVSTYAEVFFTDREYLTVAEAKKREKHPPHAGATERPASGYIPPLQPEILAIVGRVDSIDHDLLHRSLTPDQRLMRRFKGHIGPIKALRNAVESLVKKYRGH